MSPVAVILIAAITCSAAIAAWVLITERLDQPAAVPGSGQHIARIGADEKPGPDLDALTPGPGGTGWLEPVPDDDPADITGVQPAATRYLGTGLDEYVDELFEKHAEAQR